MHADQKAGRVGKAAGGALPNPFPAARHVESALRLSSQMAHEPRPKFADGGSQSPYDTPLTPQEAAQFQQWRQVYAPHDQGTDYDLAGAFKAGIRPEPERGHFPDTYKKPNHPTFSDESQYSTPDHRGGSWSRLGDRDVFSPSQYNMENLSPTQMQAYFDKNEPSAVINFPDDPAQHKRGGHIAAASAMAGQMARGKLATGGTYLPPRPGFGEMGDYRDILNPTAGGIIASEIPGRTDHIPTSVATDSYIIPADVVSGLGEGNTLAGARIIQEWMSTGPHGVPLQRQQRVNTMPRAPAASPYGGKTSTTYTPTMADGGSAKKPLKTAHLDHHPEEVPVVLAGGEYRLDPHIIAYHPDLGGLDPNDTNPKHYKRAVAFGHRVLDKWVLHERAKHIETLKGLPGPAK